MANESTATQQENQNHANQSPTNTGLETGSTAIPQENQNHANESWLDKIKETFESWLDKTKETFESWLDKTKETMHPIGRSFLWFILTLGVGLAQIWVMGLISLAVPTSLTHERIFLDGIVLFFSVVLISSLVIDHFLFGETSSNLVTKILFSVVPTATIVACVILFALCYLKTEDQLKSLDFEVIAVAELLVLAVTAGYAIIVKLDPFKNCQVSQKVGG